VEVCFGGGERGYRGWLCEAVVGSSLLSNEMVMKMIFYMRRRRWWGRVLIILATRVFLRLLLFQVFYLLFN